MTTATTALLGVLGWPVEHSLSPILHSAAFEALGLDATYLAFPVHPDALEAAIEGARALGVRGLNVTVPHKRRVMERLDHVDATARAIGAVNTIVRENDRLIGTNTDAEGLVRALAAEHAPVRGSRVLVLGAGGAARAAVAGLRAAGAASIEVAARRLEAARTLAAELGAERGSTIEEASFEGVDLLVQATSATMTSKAEDFARMLAVEKLPAHATVVDLVYAPYGDAESTQTTVLREARARGLRAVDGLGMLVHQAALALERWFDVKAPVDAMRDAAERALSQRSR